MRIEIKATVAAVGISASMLVATFSVGQILQSTNQADSKHGPQTNEGAAQSTVVLGKEAQMGARLFGQNCAHCHGDDARGDEGPNLHNLRKSDVRITNIVKGGIKGEMPSFSKKFKDADIQALIAFLRTLKD